MKWRLIAIGVLLLTLACCGSENPALDRAKRAEKAKGDIFFGAAAPWTTPGGMRLWQGIQLAVEKINTRGGVLQRKLRILKKDDGDSVTNGLVVAQSFADNKDVVAVIGHFSSYVSISTSVIYDYNGILMLSPLSTSPKLTRQGFRLVFRNIPNDTSFGEKLAQFCQAQGYKDIVIYLVNNDYGRGLSNAFENKAAQLGINISDRISYDSGSDIRAFRRDISRWKQYFKYDAILLAGVVPEAAAFIKQARKMGVVCPIISGDGLDSPSLFKIAGEAAEGISVASTFSPDDPRREVREFVLTFRKRYGFSPSEAAAQGYDAVRLLTYAMDKANSANPFKVAESLRSIKHWPGVTGDTTFDANGDVSDKPIFIKTVHQGHFVYSPPKRLPGGSVGKNL